MLQVDSAINESVLRNFTDAFTGKLDPATIDAVTRSLTTRLTVSYPAKGNVAGFLFYMQTNVQIAPPYNKFFSGDTGGIFTIGGSGYTGEVSTDDLTRLRDATDNYWVDAVPGSMTVLFFDAAHYFLGRFHGIGGGTMYGTGGGRGEWRDRY
jgi:hypothetical protein